MSLVPIGESSLDEQDGGSTKARSRPRAGRALPTDRMKMARQIDVLRAYAIAGGRGQAVANDDLAQLTQMALATVGLNNSFFRDAGLIERVSRGTFKPVKATQDWARNLSFANTDEQKAEAAHLLGPALREAWFYEAVANRLAMGSASREDLVRSLGIAAAADASHASQLGFLLDWLTYAGLLETRDDGLASLTRSVTVDPTESSVEQRERASEETHTPSTPTSGANTLPKSTVLSFNFSLTADDLSRLKPDQIKAVFEAVGGVMALQASIAAE